MPLPGILRVQEAAQANARLVVRERKTKATEPLMPRCGACIRRPRVSGLHSERVYGILHGILHGILR
jgi:hypothetical protein